MKPPKPHPVQLHAIYHMLDQSHSPQVIREVTGIAVRTIRDIQRHPDKYLRKPMKVENVTIRHYFHPDALNTNPELAKHYGQCRQCQRRVILPCVACAAERYRHRRRSLGGC